MKLPIKLAATLFSICTLLYASITSIQAQSVPKIKVMTFNTGPDRRSIDERYQEALIIATYIKNQNIEIVGLQERDYANETDNDELLLRKAFAQLDYPMYIRQVKEIKHEANIILSKYPFIEGTYKEHLVGGGRNRIIQQIAVRTPYGKLWVVNLHTNISRNCSEAQEMLDVVTNGGPFSLPKDEPMVMMGDFNLVIVSENEIAGCDSYKNLDKLLQLYSVNCLDTKHCTNIATKSAKYIDWIIATRSSGVILYSVWEDPEIRGVGDGHPVILGSIGSSRLKEVKNGDVNNDSLVDIFDYNILLGVFGQNGAPGFHPADILVNGSIDIFDYNMLVENFGK